MRDQGKYGGKEAAHARNRRLYSIIALIVLSALVLFTYVFVSRMTEKKAAVSLLGPYKIDRVIDGDTVVVIINDEKIKVRLIGIDTPESVAPSAYGKENTQEGTDAAAYLKELLKDSSVYLEYDAAEKDQYGRHLAYVYLEDAKTMVQIKLLEEGMAQVYTVQPNVKHADEFLRAQRKARAAGRGFWGSGYYQ